MKLQNMMYISLFAAMIGVLGFFPPITLPLIPVPITLQTLGVMLAGGVLGARRGGLSLLLFILLIVIGLPLLSGGRGGIGPLIGPSGGYILSWPLAAWTIGYLMEKNWHSLNLGKVVLFNMIGGIFIVYFFGVTYLSFVGNLSWGAAAISSLIFLPGDLTKAVVSGFIAIKISKTYPLISKIHNEKQLKRVG
ncbi:biotin transporter BioY [Virgibacillus siamensis]|uniref:biotin transporter BioY n=1 Tax=Virgibacillus siamensis TaxID=480071 RepID=UPI00098657FD|nr:biotin transporter BioY [Virgibacillus siamensis]